MNSIIEKIHNINIENQNDFLPTEEELLGLIEHHKVNLFNTLDKKSTDSLLKLIECMEELSFIQGRKEFELGFATGGKIVSEIFYK